MEIIDLYNNKKQRFNKTMAREAGEPMEGEYKLSVHTWILNSRGELLIQKRRNDLERNPGKWAFTGGAVDTGENSIEGAIREVQEELNITVEEEKIELLLTFKREHGFVDVFLVKKDFDIEDVKVQEEEVEKVKWVSLKELNSMLENDEFVKSVKLYYELFIRLLEKCHNLKIIK